MLRRSWAAALVAVPVAASCTLAEPKVVREIDGDPVYKLLEPDKIPSIKSPTFVTGADADAQMADREPVMGVVIDGEAHAYSLWQLDAHEIVNDRIGETAFAATW